MTEAKKIALERLAVLQLAERLGNAAEACRRSGVDRTSFYQWKRRFAREGLDGLRNRPPVHRSHPLTTPADVERRIMALGLKHPGHGCNRIEKELARQDIAISAVTIQKILHKAGLGTSQARGAALETRFAEGKRKLSAEQIAFLEEFNPCFREREAESSWPGECLCLGAFFLGRFERAGPVYVHAIVDGFSSYAFGLLSTTTRIETTLALLDERALPFFARFNAKTDKVFTNKSSDATEKILGSFLSGRSIAHLVCKDERPPGFIERFRRTAVEEFMRRPAVSRVSRANLARLQREFDDWLSFYNCERPHTGYRNYGAVPYSVVMGE